MIRFKKSIRSKSGKQISKDIAIIGMSCRFPGAINAEEFWKNLIAGKDCITEIPKERWDWRSYYLESQAGKRRIIPKWGGFIDDIDKFDAAFFHISPKEAKLMDPQQRIFLETVWQTIEDAGYKASDISGTDTGVYVGVAAHDYYGMLCETKNIEAHTCTGNQHSVLANRISYVFDFHGPSEAVDTACSSSLIAVHNAVRAIETGDCSMAIVGGVHALLTPTHFVSLGKGGMLSWDGRCKTFDEKANGYVRGEGVGAIFLKPLDRAEKDGDPIYGVIRSTAVNHGGKANSLTAPRVEAQKELLIKAHSRSGLDIESIGYIEAHGTGTKLGDPREVEALKQAFEELKPKTKRRQKQPYCGLGTVKSNIGHLEPAAGISGLIKVLLSLKYKKLAKVAHFEKLNPRIDLTNSPFYVIDKTQDWKALKDDNGKPYPLRAGVSSFGFGGANAHVVLEEYTPKQKSVYNSDGPAIVLLSAKNEERLKDQAGNLLSYLKSNLDSSLYDLAYTLQKGREFMEERLAFVAESKEALSIELAGYLEGKSGNYLNNNIKNKKPDFQLEGNTGKAYIHQAIADKESILLAKLWIEGVSIDWNLLYKKENLPNKINLPTYTFARERYWIPESSAENTPVPPDQFEKQSEARKLTYYTTAWNPLKLTLENQTKDNVLICSRNPESSLVKALRKSLGSIDVITPGKTHPITVKGVRGLIDLTPLEGENNKGDFQWISLLQELIEKNSGVPLKLMVVSYIDGLQGAERFGLYSMLQGEYSKVDSSHFELEEKLEEEEHCNLILEAYKGSVSYTRLKYYNGQCCYPVLKELKIKLGVNSAITGPVLITGGTRGIGMRCAKHLLKHHGVNRLVLMGRQTLPERKDWSVYREEGSIQGKKIRDILYLEKQGAHVKLFYTPLSDEKALRSSLGTINSEWGPIQGFLHCAGHAMDNTPFIRKQIEHIASVQVPKVSGLNNLHEVLKEHQLKFGIFYSSVSALVPRLGVGYSDYAMANSYMDRFATHHRLSGFPYTSIQWPSWKETGMGEVTGGIYKALGFLSMTNDEGLQVLDTVLSEVPPVPVLFPAIYNRNIFNPEKILLVNSRVKEFSVTATSQSSINEWLKGLVSQEIKLPLSDLEINVPLQEYGLDSILLAGLTKRIEDELEDVSISPIVIIEHPTIGMLGDYMEKQFKEALSKLLTEDVIPGDFIPKEKKKSNPLIAKNLSKENNRTSNSPIAVIGMACHFPDAKNIAQFWENLKSGKDSIREVPSTRWDSSAYYSATKSKGKSISKWGAFLENIEEFDPDYFGISRELASQIDPLERQWLEVSAEAIADAGYTKEDLWGKFIGVFAGSRTSNFLEKIGDAHKDVIVGTGQNFITAYLSHIYNLKGPNMVVDTACSSSLTAIDLAVKSLRSGETEISLAGGVDILLDERNFVMLSTAEVLSPDGRSKTFDERADGTGLGEGCGVLVLKKLNKAIASGDKIYGIIEGSSINNDGNTMGITTPNPQSQQVLIERAITDAGIDRATISYIESHGTGTPIGDPIELQGITRALHLDAQEKSICGVGSVKSNIGHLLSASGVAGVIKTLLSITTKQLPPTLHCDIPNPRFDFNNSPLYLLKELQNWDGVNGIRRAGVSSFGLGGHNAHLIVSDAGIPEVNRVTLPLNPPSIPYRRLRYWFDNTQPHSSETKDSNEQGFKKYLQGSISKQLKDWVVEVEFDHNNYILRDHSVHNIQIVPGVTYLDMVLRYANELFDQAFSLRNIIFTTPLATTKDYNRNLLLRYHPIGSSTYRAIIHSQQKDHNGEAFGLWSEHMRCDLTLLESPEEKVFNITSFIAHSQEQMKVSDIYAKARKLEIRHGVFMQASGKIYQLGEEELMELHLGALAENYRDVFVAHPAFLDASTFSGSLLGLKKDQNLSRETEPYIPFSIDSFEVYHPFPSKIYVFSKYQKPMSGEEFPDIIKKNIYLYDIDGKLLARFKDLVVKRIRHPELIKQLVKSAAQEAKKAQEKKEGHSRVYADRKTNAIPLSFDKRSNVSTRTFLRAIISKKLKKKITVLEDSEGFYELGLNSNQTLEIVRELETKYGHNLYPTLLFEYQNIVELSDYLSKIGIKPVVSTEVDETEEISLENQYKDEMKDEKSSSTWPRSQLNKQPSTNAIEDEPIAIIGLSGRYPGACNIAEFWKNLKQGKNSITEIPKDRWDASDYFDQEKGRDGKSYSKWGGFVEDIDKFDPLFFNISPRDAKLMDPQVRLFLEESWKTIEDSGYTPKQLSKQEKVGVFAGVFWTDYQLYRTILPLSLTSSFVSMVANTVSYQMGFQGPSIGLDTQCSSSLTAIHLACESIKRGESTMALAGGVNLSLHPSKYNWLSASMFLSSTGQCESFGLGGDGYVPGEGVGAVLLKSLKRAKVDGDQIYGIINGTAINHGGKSSGFTVPNPMAQAAVIKEAINKAGIKPEDLSYIEAHGTGTSLGDPIEIAGLIKAFQTEKKQYCSIGSVKSNIGHAESAAGISGLTKILLQLKHKQLVPSLHSKTLNPNIDFKNSPFRVQQELQDWKVEDNKPRLAGISSFGAGGSNAHIIIEEYVDELKIKNQELRIANAPAIIVLSAKNEERLEKLIENLKTYLEENKGTKLSDLAYTLQTGREAMEERLAFIADNENDLINKLNHYFEEKTANLFLGNIRKEKLDFLLEGDAGQAYIQTAISKKQIKALAQLWVKGVYIDWNLLYPDQRPQKISLPTYPFAKKRYWIPERDAPVKNISNNWIHPLLHLNTSRFKEQSFSSEYNGHETFLEHHQINGDRVLPGVAYLELAREAGSISLGRPITQIKDITWLTPIRVINNPEKIQINLFEKADAIDYEICTRDGEEKLVHGQGKLSATKLTPLTSLDITGIKDRLPHQKLGTECYEIFKTVGIDYGSSFQGIAVLYYSATESLSVISLPEEADYFLHPGLMDSALQTCIGLSFLASGSMPLSLPFSVKEVNIYGVVNDTEWCYARRSSNNQPGSKIDSYDIDMLSASGDILLSFKCFVMLPIVGHVQNINRSTKADSVEEALRLHLFVEQWREQKISVQSERIISDQLILLAGGSAVLADKLQEITEQEIIAIQEATEIGYYNKVLEIVQSRLRSKERTDITVIFRNTDYVDHSFISGLLKTASMEAPKLNGKTIGVAELSIGDIESLVDIIRTECGNYANEVRYKDKKREVRKFRSIDPNSGSIPEELLIKEGGVYLITGGCGGLGQIFANQISKTKAVTTILTGRSKKSSLSASRLKTLSAVYHSCDLTDKDAVEGLIAEIVKTYGQLDGIIHSAGIIRDSFLLNKDKASSASVLSPKILGAKHLDQSTQDIELDFMIFFSSISGVLGNVGQGDYASANAWLDSYAHYRSDLQSQGKRSGISVSINWPLWREGGMQINQENQKFLEKKLGLYALPTREGISVLDTLSEKTHQVIVGYGKRTTLANLFTTEPGDVEIESVSLSTDSPSETLAQIKDRLVLLISELLELEKEEIEVDLDFSEYGIDSIAMMRMLNLMEETFEVTAEPTAIVNYPTVCLLAEYIHNEKGTVPLNPIDIKPVADSVSNTKKLLRDLDKSKASKESEEFPKSGKVAIVGISCRLPESDNLEEYWDNLKNGNDLISNTPESRWKASDYYSAEGGVDKTYTTKGGFIRNAGVFDARYFNISDSDAISMDPQQRIILELSRALFAHAGFKKEELASSNTAVYIGAKDNSYLKNNYHLLPKGAYQHAIVNNIGNMIAARLSDFYDLKGTSQTIDTACSSSLVAIHQGCEEILQGKADMVVAGGIFIMTDAFNHIGFSQAEVLSKDGKCYVFDERAKGFVIGEGGGLVLLKSYEQAKAEGDRIYGVICGSSVNNDGKTMGLTIPNIEGQKQVIEQALSKTKINPRDITYYEAHGTGTLLGDPIEVKAATEVYQKLSGENQARQYCAMGSVKSNLGHSMTSAAVSGLIKILLQLQHKTLVPTIHCEKPHPRFKFEMSPFYPNTELKDWQTSGSETRKAAISSFGFGGTNCHMIIEEGNDPKEVRRQSLPVERLSNTNYWLGQNLIKDSSIQEIEAKVIKQKYQSQQIYTYNEPIMRDHLIFARQILMGVAHLSLSIDMAKAIYPNSGFQLEKMLFSNPMVLEEGETASQRGLYKAEEQIIEISYEINGLENIAARSAVSEFNFEEKLLDLVVLKAKSKKQIKGVDYYDLPGQETYGLTTRTVQDLWYLSDGKVLVSLQLSEEQVEAKPDFLIHPAVFDGVHVAATLSLDKNTIAALKNHRPPLMIKRIQISDKAKPFSLNCFALIVPKLTNDQISEFDIEVYTEQGQLMVTMEGFTTKSVPSYESLMGSARKKQEGADSPSNNSIALPAVQTEIKQAIYKDNIGDLKTEVILYLKTSIATILNKRVDAIPLDQNFMDLGLESNQMINMANTLEIELGVELYPTLFFEFQNIDDLSGYFLEDHGKQMQVIFGKLITKEKVNDSKPVNTPVSSSESTLSRNEMFKSTAVISPLNFGQNASEETLKEDKSSEDIAIIGMSGYFPESKNIDEFWKNIASGKDMIREIPIDHWDYRPWFNENRELENKTYSKWGGFLTDIDKFDPTFFGMSPRQAEWMDPQVRLLLQSTYHTFEDAGVINRIRGTKTGVFVGSCFHEYWDEIVRGRFPITDYEHISSVMSNLSSAISYQFDLQGNSIPLDNACASSMTALHLGCQAILAGEIENAVIAGLNVLLSPLHYVYFSRIQALSPTGRCHTFDKKADGYVPGEGVVSILIKPLSKAIAEGDCIHGVIKGSAINHMGRSNNPASPRPELQTKLLLEAWKKARINPEDISYIEAHGTGTTLGDPIEINALKRAFKKHTAKESFCHIGSTKAHVGHLEGAAGLTSIVKVLQMMKHNEIPTMPNFEVINPYIKLENSPLKINTKNELWNLDKPKLAGISSFGMTGNNAHVVLEEYISKQDKKYISDVPAIILLSAKNEDRLKDQARNLQDYINLNPDAAVYDIAYTLQVAREPMADRIAFVVNNVEELLAELAIYLKGKSGVYFRGNSKNEQLDFSLESNAAKAFIDSAIENRESNSLAQLWVKGGQLDWNLLYRKENCPNKIKLPVYPFAQDRYWIPLQEDNSNITTGKLHPLLHSNDSNLNEQKYRSVYTGLEHFLTDHHVNEDKMLPGVAYLELARAAGTLSAEEPVTQIKDITWLSPIRVNGSPKTIYTRIYPIGEEMGYKVYSQSDEEQVHSQGKLITTNQPAPSNYDMEALQKQFTQYKDKVSFYDLLKSIGLNLGSTFRGIKRLWYSDSGALSKITLPKVPGYVLFPGIMDSALQTFVGLSLDKGMLDLSLPFSIKEVNIYLELPESVWAYARKSASHNERDGVISYDIDILNESGEVLISVRGFTVLPLNGISNQQVEEKCKIHYYNNDWMETDGVLNQEVCDSQFVLVAGGTEDFLARLKEKNVAEIVHIVEETEVCYFLSVFEKVKEILAQKTSANITIICENNKYLDYGFASGLLKTAHLEYPKVTGKVLGVNSLSAQQISELTDILNFEHGQSDSEVRYIDGNREVKLLKSASPKVVNEDATTIKEGGVYLITGGFGGLGQIFADHINRKKDTMIILAGRSALTEENKKILSDFQNTVYYVCDVSIQKEVFKLIETIRSKYGALNGIIHSAGVIRDSIIQNKTPDEIEVVLSAKIMGARYLDEATRKETLDFMVFFSSTAGVLGNIGQSDYASANAFLDNYALYRDEQRLQGKREGKTLSINWPFWKEGGMRVDNEIERYLEKRWGIIPLTASAGISAFETLLKTKAVSKIVTYGYQDRTENFILQKPKSLKIDKTNTIDYSSIQKQVKENLLEIIADLLKLDIAGISEYEEIGNYGFDSLMLTKLSHALNKYYDLDLVPILFFNYPTIEKLSVHLMEDHTDMLLKKHAAPDEISVKLPDSASGSVQVASQKKPRFRIPDGNAVSVAKDGSKRVLEDIAIVGISGRFPGSPDVKTFWENISNNKDLITKTPKERWDWKSYYSDLHEYNEAKWGGFISDIDKFDPMFFNLSPREAELMDPQQRITLEAVYHAFEDAGIAVDTIRGSNTGIFIGVASSDYSMLIGNQKGLANQAQFPTGSSHSILVNRISYLLDLHGPSEPIDTACSSSLIAVHRAVEHIRNGHCDMAIAGGVNALLSPNLTLAFSQSGMLSEDGRCKTFDQGANGYVRGEGVGVVILKSLGKAEADNDHIYGVVRATAENHGGKANTLTSPNPMAQKELLLKAYRSANIDPRDISYIEAHGTGTPLGDPIEIEGLKMTFKELLKESDLEIPKAPYCSLGSVKTNIGHLEAAAGIAGIMKVLLSLKYRTLPGNVHLKTPNTYLKLKDSPFYLQQETSKWLVKNDRPRIAGVSSFGFGGANSHIIIEEYIPKKKKAFQGNTTAIIILSAKNKARLQEQVKNLEVYLQDNNEVNIYDVAYTLQLGRESMEERLAFLAGSVDRLIVQLNDYLQKKVERFLSGNSKEHKNDFMLEGESGEAYIKTAIAKQEIRALAQLWVKGISIDWNLLYKTDNRPNKINLPVYPFARERYWFPMTKEIAPNLFSSRLHPLLHSNESDLATQKYLSLFTGKESFLSDHRVKGEKVLPGVAYLELAREAGERSLNRPITQLKDVAWLSPINVGNRPKQIHIRLFEQEHSIRYEVYSHSIDNEDVPNPEVVHAEGEISMTEPNPPLSFDIDMIKDRLESQKSGDECYALFKKTGLNYGPSFQGITVLHYNKLEALSKITLPKEVGYVLQPGLLDSALQTCFGLSFGLEQEEVSISLPFTVKEMNIYSDISDSSWCYARKSEDNQVGSNFTSYDIDLLSEAGEVLLEFKNLLAFPFEKSNTEIIVSQEDSVAAKSGLYYNPVWQRARLSDEDLSSNQKSGIIAIVAQKNDYAHELKSALESMGNKVVIMRTLEDLSPLVRSIFLLQGLDIYKGQNSDTDQIGHPEFSVFNSLKMLQSQERDNIDLTIVTRNTQLVLTSDKVEESGSGIVGLIGSLAKEIPGWQFRLVDIEKQGTIISDILRVPFTSSVNLLALREGCLYDRKLIPMTLTTHKEKSKFRKAGVYVILGGAGGIGRVTTKYLIRHYNAQVYWLGRRKEDKEIRSYINALSEHGPSPVYLQCDATDRLKVVSVYQQIKSKETTIHGLFHSAIVLDDKLFSNMEISDFRKVFDIKSRASSHLVESFRKANLDFICFYSSVQSYINAPGQSNYAAGCTYKDSFARKVEQQFGIPSFTMHWGYWGEVGVVSTSSNNRFMEKMGIGSIDEKEGMEALEVLLSGNERQLVVIKFIGDQIFNKISVFDLDKKIIYQEAISKIKPAKISLNGMDY